MTNHRAVGISGVLPPFMLVRKFKATVGFISLHGLGYAYKVPVKLSKTIALAPYP